MRTLEELRARRTEVIDRLRALDSEAGESALTGDSATEWEALLEERSSLDADITREEERACVRSTLGALVTENGDSGRDRPDAPNINIRQDPYEGVLSERGAVTSQVMAMPRRQRERTLTDAILRTAEDHIEDGPTQARFEKMVRQNVRRYAPWAVNILARSRDEYAEAFAYVLTGRTELLTDEMRAALVVGTSANGGYLVPTYTDPTLILTNVGSQNIMRQLATVKSLVTGNTWKGITTAGVTASWDAETAEVSDDSPTFANPSIATNKPQAFIQASIEAEQDIPGLESDLLNLFGDARDRLEGAGFLTGTGANNQPKGLFTAIAASSTLHTVSTTAATIGAVDIHALYKALPQRWRGRGTWIGHTTYMSAVKQLGTAVSASYSGDLRDPLTDVILARPAYANDDCPSTQTTTALDQEIVFADLSEYYIVDIPGSTAVEYIPHLFNTSNNLPDGRRGWYMYWRTGGDMPNLAAGRILVDKTSA